MCFTIDYISTITIIFWDFGTFGRSTNQVIAVCQSRGDSCPPNVKHECRLCSVTNFLFNSIQKYSKHLFYYRVFLGVALFFSP